MISHASYLQQQRGIVLISSMLMLVIVTILGVAMFRSFGIDEKIAGNNREKQLALNYAQSAEQYAEWWLKTGGNGAGTGSVVSINCTAALTATTATAVGQSCTNALANTTDPTTWAFRTNYTPDLLNVPSVAYSKAPAFYINMLSSVNQVTYYRINAVGYGPSPSAVAIVETVFKCQPLSINYTTPSPMPTSC